MAAAAVTAAFFLSLFLSISFHVISFPFQDTADSPQSTPDFLNYAPPVDDHSITGLLPESPISPNVGVPVGSGKEPSEDVAAPTVGAPVEGGNEPSTTVIAPAVGAPSVGGAPVKGGNEQSATVIAPSVGAPSVGGAPVEGGNEPSATVVAPTVGAPIVGGAPVEGENEPSVGSESSSVNGGVEEQEPRNDGSPGLSTPSASPVPSTPAAAPAGGLNGPFGQRQQQLEGSANGEEQGLGAQPLVDNTPFDSGSRKMGYFRLFGYAGFATLAFLLV